MTASATNRGLELAVAAESFHRAYYDSGVWFDRTTWLGVPIWKQPLDLWIYQELVAELRPDVILETGTWNGGSALYLAQLCELLGHGQVVTVDIQVPEPDLRPQHPRIRYLLGPSTHPQVLEQVREACHDATVVLVILDSDHGREHVFQEMTAYAPLVTLGSYLIVEDTNLTGHPVRPEWGPGPAEAVTGFLAEHADEFTQDRGREKFGMTFHPGGFLRRKAPARAWQIPFVPPMAPRVAASAAAERDHTARTLYLCDRDDNNQGQWRIARPCLEAARHGFVADWVSFDSVGSIQSWLAGGRYNVVVTPRMMFAEDAVHERWAEARARDGLTWIYETDDDLFSPECVEREVRVFGADRELMEFHRQCRLRMLRDCDGVIVSRPSLVEVVREHTAAPIRIVPNAIDVEWFEARLAGHVRQIAPLTVGWSGASRERDDLELVAEAWATLAARFPELRFVVQGNAHAHALLKAVPAARLTLLPWTTVDEHPRSLLNIDIACCAVADTAWNHCKSPNKWLEATLAGSACVVSHALYGDYVTPGHDALVARTAEEWTDALARLIEDAELRAALNEQARATLAREHALSTQWQRWPRAWAELLSEARSNGPFQMRQSHAERRAAPAIAAPV